jgi:hypothetical protein
MHTGYRFNGPAKALVLVLIFISTALRLAASMPGTGITEERKRVVAVRTAESIQINGSLDEASWQQAQPATDFVIYNPYNGVPSSFRTEVRVLYDNDALYIGAMMYDNHPDSIFTGLGERDAQDINADHFYIEISPFNDGLNGEMFKVSASNVQIDNKLSTSDDWHNDDTWDAVWDSRTKITDNGWIAEIKIPYSALRFPKTEGHIWGINFWREVRRVRETSSWNFVTKEYGATIAHLGEMSGISDVKPPLRLSLVPYVSGYLEHFTGQPGVGTSYNGGLDLKLGLTESFTLDATLIPDFGQVQSDDRVLNLTPYEVKYNEKRPFFMEGTELFNRGDIFYSRRIGGVPHLADRVYDMTDVNEIVTNNPTEVSLLNATKISGRTRGGLGIGLFNAVTNSVWAEVTDTVTGARRKIMTEPVTNYNMVVLDQTLKNDSYISVMNTNVIRAAEKDENFYTANVTGFQSLLQTKSKLYSVSASAILSQKYFSSEPAGLGHFLEFNIGKTGGKFRTDYNFSLMSDTYDPNDMGYLRNNNGIGHSIDFSYNTYEPSGNIMSTRAEAELNYSQLFSPRAYTAASLGMSGMIIFMNYWSFDLEALVQPWGENDYFEPRTSDMSMYYHRSPSLIVAFRGDTDKSKKLYVQAEGSFFKAWSQYNEQGFGGSAEAEYKLSRRFSLVYQLGFERSANDIGFVDRDIYENIYFGKRDVTTFENTLSSAFIFTANSYLTLRCRHYWSRAVYDGSYYILQDDGSFTDSDYYRDPNVNTNFFNVDLVYTWRFAPGSELSVVWKNAIFTEGEEIVNDAWRNFNDMLSSPQTNSISLKILYYLDYQNLRRWFSSR